MIDLTKLELRPLIYKERKDIRDFDIQNPKSLDSFMYDCLTSSPVVEFNGAPDYILDIFNNVYYITTIILMEQFPVMYQSRYILIAEHTSSPFNDLNEVTSGFRYFECLIIAMVYNYLRVLCPNVYTNENDNKLLKAFWDYHCKAPVVKGINGNLSYLFYDNILDDKWLKQFRIDKRRFEPLHTFEELMAMEKLEQETEKDLTKLKARNTELMAENDKLKNTIASLQKELMERKPDVQPEDEEVQMLNELEGLPVLKILWHLMQLDGAKVEGHGKKKYAQNLLSTLSTIPYNTTKHLWEKENDPVTRQEEKITKMNLWMKAIGMKYQL